ncbi:hypothetical protein OAG39_01665 [Verrucomicrobiales bacterium]|nr:hypothetical protein [Verrucomicrobiales bacterium]
MAYLNIETEWVNLQTLTSYKEEYEPGQVLLGFPKHICPTVALHNQVSVINGDITSSETWEVNARDRV